MARLRRRNIAALIVALAVLLLAYAWIKGGREPLHEISEDVTVPGGAK